MRRHLLGRHLGFIAIGFADTNVSISIWSKSATNRQQQRAKGDDELEKKSVVISGRAKRRVGLEDLLELDVDKVIVAVNVLLHQSFHLQEGWEELPLLLKRENHQASKTATPNGEKLSRKRAGGPRSP